MFKALHLAVVVSTLTSPLQATKHDQNATPVPVLSYTFDSADCAASYVRSDSSSRGNASLAQNLVRNDDCTSCTPSLGIVTNGTGYDAARPYAIKSQQSLLETFETVGAEGYGVAFEVWIKGATTTRLVDGDPQESILQPILTVGHLATTVPSPDLNDLSDCGRNSLIFQVAQRGKYLEIVYRTSDTVFEACQRFRSTTAIPMGKLTHLVVSLRESEQIVFLNGVLEASVSRPFANSLDHWLKFPDYGVQLMAYPMHEKTQLWDGTTYKIAVYDSFLNESSVSNLFSSGLPPSPPYALNYTVSINEDAEQVPGSHDPEWYLVQSPIREAQTIDLQMEWVDRDVHDLLESFNHIAALELRPLHIYITRLPTHGCLYEIDGTMIGCGTNKTDHTVFVPLADELHSIVYLPPLNQHSVMDDSGSLAKYTSLSYCVSERVLVSARQCSSVGTIRVIVVPVNDPPIAINPGTFRVKESLNSTGSPKILLSGFDKDENDTVQMVQVTSPPKKGSLHLSVSSFRRDNLRHGTSLSDLGYEIPNASLDPVYAFYLFDPAIAKGSVVQGQALSDSFSFRVCDKSGTWSADQIVRINIQSAVSGQSTTVVTVPENFVEGISFQWFGFDRSGYRRDLRFLVESVPESWAGSVHVNGTGTLVQSGDMLESVQLFPYDKGVSLSFVPAPNFCTGRDIHTSTVIRFHAVALEHGSDRIASVSEPHDQKVVVTCTPDSVVWSAPPGPFDVTAMALPSAAARVSERKSLIWNSTNADNEYALRIPGIEFATPDTTHERILVSVRTGAGFLSFGQHGWMRTDPVHGRSTQRGGNATFYISPVYLEEIFSNFTYQSHTPGLDSIDIQLEVGNCTMSLPNSTWLTNSSTCQRVRKSIPIVIHADPHAQPTTRLIAGYYWQLLQLFLSMIGYPALFWMMTRLEDSLWIDEEDDEETVFDANEPLWIQHCCLETGDYYYENRDDGTVTWLAPVGESYVPWKDGLKDDENELA